MAISQRVCCKSFALGTCQSVTTLCRPNSENEKTRLKLDQIRPLKNTKKNFDRPVDRSVELGLGFCYQQSVYGVGSLAEGRRLRAAKWASPNP